MNKDKTHKYLIRVITTFCPGKALRKSDLVKFAIEQWRKNKTRFSGRTSVRFFYGYRDSSWLTVDVGHSEFIARAFSRVEREGGRRGTGAVLMHRQVLITGYVVPFPQ